MSRGSAGNVIAALASAIIPGLGQLVQGRLLAAFIFFLIAGVIWGVALLLGFVTLGLLLFVGYFGHIIAALEAALWKPRD